MVPVPIFQPITTNINPLIWNDGTLQLLDQRALPACKRYLTCHTVEEVADAIMTLAVRGAPLIGITAVYGMALAARTAPDSASLAQAFDLLAGTRPTAVNLFAALARCREHLAAPRARRAAALLAEALAIHAEEAAACQAMAKYGATLLKSGARVLTHCNTGALATGGIGTALGVIRAAHAVGTLTHVWVDETRPLLQGARLTAWELQQDGIPFTILCDNAAASLMRSGQVDAVLVGADRIAANGDTANKIGTYSLAVLAHAHHVPCYVVAPWSTVDLQTPDGAAIPIEQRDPEEVLSLAGFLTAPLGANAWNPAFDVTPAALVTAYVTERGIEQTIV